MLPQELRKQVAAESIEEMVHRFYGRVRQDAVLAPVFDARITDWEPHLARMTAFWRSILLGDRSFVPGLKGSPVDMHRRIEELAPGHFSRWLALFGEVTSELFPAPVAEHIQDQARRIGVSLSAHLAEA